MSLDWEQFRNIVEQKNDDRDIHEQLMRVVNEQDFLIDFFTQLSKELKEMKAASEIVDKYPHAGILLTKAATHPYLGYTLSMAESLITCLIQYSKLDLNANNEVALDLSSHSNRSIIWCIVRLRRLISVSQSGRKEERPNTQLMIQKISNLLDVKANQLDSQKITKLTDMCLILAHSKEAQYIIKRLVTFALVESTSSVHFDHSQPLLSDKFIRELANSNTQQPVSLRTHYLSWPNELKQSLFICYDELLEFEILDLIETYLSTTRFKYIPSETLETQLMQNTFIQSIQTSPILVQRILHHLSNYTIYYQHWNIVRLSQCLNRCLNSQLYKDLHLYMKNDYTDRLQIQEVHDTLMNYIFSGGTIKDIPKRRNEAWCLSLSFHRFTWYCVYGIVQWCQSGQPWSQQMEHSLSYLNWMIYPSLDNRESESLAVLRQWIQTCSGNNKLCDELPKRWHNLLNRHGILIACFVTSIFFSNGLHVDQQISLIQSIFVQQKDFHRNTKNRNDLDAAALAYLCLDYLNDMELNTHLYPPTECDIKIIRTYIFEHYLSS